MMSIIYNVMLKSRDKGYKRLITWYKNLVLGTWSIALLRSKYPKFLIAYCFGSVPNSS